MGGSPCVGWSMRPGEGELNKCVIRISSALGCLSHIAWDLGQRSYIHTSSFEESVSPRHVTGEEPLSRFRSAQHQLTHGRVGSLAHFSLPL